MRNMALVVVTSLLPFNGACVIVLGDGTGPSGAGGADGKTSALPDPEEWRVPPPEFTPEQQRRKDEVDAYIAKVVYKDKPITKTVQGYSGDILDYVQMPPLGVTVPEIPALLSSTALPEGVTHALTEVEQYPELWGPTDATLFNRPDFSRYILEDTGATSIQDWITNHQVHGLPDAAYRLYAGLNVVAPNRGASARINQFKPEVADRTFSLIELAVRCPAVGDATEFIGLLLTVDRVNSGADWVTNKQELRLRVEYYQNVNGNVTHSYDFQAAHFTEMPPEAVNGWPWTTLGEVVTPSVPGGAQTEAWLAWVMDPQGSWWAFYNGRPLGHYSHELLPTLKQGACGVHYYGEVFDPKPEDGWAPTEMGSGQFATAPAGHVAWVREPKYLDMNWLVTDPQDDAFERWSKPYEPSCYTRSSMVDLGWPWQYFLLGGPGGKDPLCKKP
ncbi:neprosin family prolyl endopeptidase [Polyangium spumosum]|uniref:DUF239 domain-containing protein n=1 Tax=Polyangium spumosum TaxID=889282 RepID=A0A6N7Q3R6_9BACT|nr:neprosin family prolyl endopeptidase [Polyangium spumosum]MRG97856.1 DUF239 domain-containing protein [Polyangium spumosum]